MKILEIPILGRSRQYGYIYWKKDLDKKVSVFFKDAESVSVVFDGAKLGDKKIDYKHRRISVGWRWTRNLPNGKTKFVLRKIGNTVYIII